MLDIESFMKALKSTWVRRLITCQNKTWLSLFTSTFFDTKCITDFGAEFLSKTIIKCNNKFWKDVFSCWQDISTSEENFSNSSFLTEPIWYNKKFRIDSKCLCIKQWYLKGVKCVADLYGNNGILLDFNTFRSKFDIVSNNYLI